MPTGSPGGGFPLSPPSALLRSGEKLLSQLEGASAMQGGAPAAHPLPQGRQAQDHRLRRRSASGARRAALLPTSKSDAYDHPANLVSRTLEAPQRRHRIVQNFPEARIWFAMHRPPMSESHWTGCGSRSIAPNRCSMRFHMRFSMPTKKPRPTRNANHSSFAYNSSPIHAGQGDTCTHQFPHTRTRLSSRRPARTFLRTSWP